MLDGWHTSGRQSSSPWQRGYTDLPYLHLPHARGMAYIWQTVILPWQRGDTDDVISLCDVHMPCPVFVNVAVSLYSMMSDFLPTVVYCIFHCYCVTIWSMLSVFLCHLHIFLHSVCHCCCVTIWSMLSVFLCHLHIFLHSVCHCCCVTIWSMLLVFRCQLHIFLHSVCHCCCVTILYAVSLSVSPPYFPALTSPISRLC